MEYKDKVSMLTEILRSGEKSKDEFKIGVEIEHIVVDKATLESINYYQNNGIEVILKKLMKYNYKPKYEEDYLIGLEAEEGMITLEPGGQLEISIKPCSTIQEIEEIYFDFLNQVIPVLEEHNQFLMAIGYHPRSSILDLPFNPKKRYGLMSAYLKEKGCYAHNMMKGTAALQVSIDYSDEEDYIKKLRVANFLSPIFAYITDNAPIFEGKTFDANSLRSLIWQNTDSARSGIIPKAMDKLFGYNEYADYLLKIEPILIIKDNIIISSGNLKTSELMEDYSFTKEELMHIMTMVFPDVRSKRYLEIRMGDSMPYPYNFSYITLIKGIFYREEVLNKLYELSQEIDTELLIEYKASMIENGREGKFLTGRIKDFIPCLFDLVKEYLPEEEYLQLAPLEDLIKAGKNPSAYSKELLLKEGIESLSWCSLNGFIQEGEQHGNIGAI